MKKLLAVPLILLGVGAHAAGEKPDALSRTFERIRRTAFAERNTYAMLTSLCETAPHRLSGSAGAAAAVEWAKDAMKRAGLTNVRLEPVMVPHWERGEVEDLRIVRPGDEEGETLPILALGGSIATPKEGITAEVIEVKTFAELSERAAEAKGRIVLFNRPMDPTLLDPGKAYGKAVGQRANGAVEAAKVGAVAAVVRSMTTRIDDVPHTGGMRYAKGVTKIPTAAVSTRGAERIAGLLAAGKKFRLRLRLSCRRHEDKLSHNVIGELTGREKPKEILVVGGHLDSWDVGEGAHDDGAGCCQAIEAARLLKALDLVPRRTIRVVLFMNEENGLRGGRAYAKDHVAELPRHVLALESDAGGFTPRGFTTDANPRAMVTLRAVARRLDAWGAGTMRPGGGGADISPMAPAGVIQVGYLPDLHRYFDLHHTAIDTIDKVSERELELGTAAIASLLYAVAEAEETLPRNAAEKR